MAEPWPICPALAHLTKLIAEETGVSPALHLSLNVREGCMRWLRDNRPQTPADVHELAALIDEIAASGTETEQQLNRLRGAVMLATDKLGCWLTDNTEEVFEEQPEIDEVKSLLEDALEAI